MNQKSFRITPEQHQEYVSRALVHLAHLGEWEATYALAAEKRINQGLAHHYVTLALARGRT